jgi:hypothetical protein
MSRAVEQNRAARHAHGHLDGADERHVDRLVRQLQRGAGEVDGEGVALDSRALGGVEALLEPVAMLVEDLPDSAQGSR